MTEFDETADENKDILGQGTNTREPVAPSRWVNPILGVLGALVLSGNLMSGYPSIPAATMPTPRSDQQPAPAQISAHAAFREATGSLGRSGSERDETNSSSMTDLLKTAFAAGLALAWAAFGAWLAMRRARLQNPVLEPAVSGDLPRVRTCDRMYDKTRLVPHYLRSIEFPAMKHDLVRLAKEHTDEGRALCRLERIPDRPYSSLHDLITQIHID